MQPVLMPFCSVFCYVYEANFAHFLVLILLYDIDSAQILLHILLYEPTYVILLQFSLHVAAVRCTMLILLPFCSVFCYMKLILLQCSFGFAAFCCMKLIILQLLSVFCYTKPILLLSCSIFCTYVYEADSVPLCCRFCYMKSILR